MKDGDEVNQSALYAMQYDEGGLAMSAYDARYARAEGELTEDLNGDEVVNEKDWKLAAQSPAVDAGSDDAYSYDSTSTNPKVIDMSQPDIGYHYYRRVADDDPPLTAGRKIEISFRQPPMPDYVDTDNLNYVIAIPSDIPGEDPDVIKHFPYNEHRGKAVINEPIVEGIDVELVYEQTYNLDAYSKIGDYEQNPPEGTEVFQFKIIVDSQPPILE